MPLRRTNLEEATEWITRRIETGEWPVDSRIPSQDELVAALGIGHTVLRQALKIMSSNGMLESARGRGTFVRARSPVNTVLGEYLRTQPAPRTLELRRALEAEAAGLAAAHRTDQHLALLRAALVNPQERCWTSSYRSATGRTDVSLDVFHATVFAASLNPLLTETHLCTVSALRYARLETEATDLRDAGHRRIFDAIESGDVEAARSAAAAHADRDRPAHDG
ncbi:MAG TPA: FCD domain-containing protein [Umezawaea sp.]|nr:FCD domain-containing protein [Umezawaea sp.]